MTTTKQAKEKTGSAVATRAGLVLALWLGFWLLALGLIAGLLWIPFAQLSYRTLNAAGIAAGLAALTLAYALRPRRRHRAGAPLPLLRESAPALYAAVEKVGARLGITAPLNMFLVNQASASVLAKRNWYGKVKSLEVGMGMPLLITLSDDELGVVFAHEFGKFVAGDLALGPWVYRTRASIANTLNELGDSLFFLDLLFAVYGHFFLRLSAAVSRAQVFEADALAAKKFGRTVTCNALKKVNLIEPMWAAYVDHELLPALGRGARMPVFDGFRRFCRPGVRRHEVEAAIRGADARAPSPYDPHPTLDERLDAIKPEARAGMPPPLAECLHLLGGEEGAEIIWYDFFTDSHRDKCSWDRLGPDVVQPQIQQRFADTWMAKLPLSELNLMAGEPAHYWDRLKPEGISFLSPGGKRKHVLAIVEEWLIASLIERDFKLVITPGQPLRMLRGSQTVLPAELLLAAQDGKLAAGTLAPLEVGAARVDLSKG